jgi:pimeloyl-ACP methyl ester carboxylesterase
MPFTSKLPFVLVHGWPVTEEHWRYFRTALEDQGADVITVTLPGLGKNPNFSVSDVRKMTLARSLIKWLSSHGVRRCTLVGHDWGATVATITAAMAPELVAALIVEEEILPGVAVDIPEPGRNHYPTWHGPLNRVEGLTEKLMAGRESHYYEAFLSQSAGPVGLDPILQADYTSVYIEPNVHSEGLAYYRTRIEDLADIAALPFPISMPVLAVGGEYGMGSAVVQGMQTLASHVDGALIRRAGHYPAEQEPDEFMMTVEDFVNRHVAA